LAIHEEKGKKKFSLQATTLNAQILF